MATRDRPGDNLIRPGVTGTRQAAILGRTEAGLLTIRNPGGKITYVIPGPDAHHELVDISELADANPPCFGLNRVQRRARRRDQRRNLRDMRRRKAIESNGRNMQGNESNDVTPTTPESVGACRNG